VRRRFGVEEETLFVACSRHAREGEQTTLRIWKCRRHPRAGLKRLHIVRDETVQELHGFPAADEDATARREIEETRARAAAHGFILRRCIAVSCGHEPTVALDERRTTKTVRLFERKPSRRDLFDGLAHLTVSIIVIASIIVAMLSSRYFVTVIVRSVEL
jgi:hypothetical protein